MQRFDAIVIGGGLVGAAIAYGLARRGLSTALLDEGDVAFRAARGNFGLVWVQSKGLGVPEYQAWSRLSSELWDDFATALREETGIDCAHQHRGGVSVCLSEEELAQRRQMMEQLHLESGETRFEYEMLDPAALKRLIPAIGPQVIGGVYTRYDGCANPLYLLRALHGAFLRYGGKYRANAHVASIAAAPNDFTVALGTENFRAGKLVLAAGLGNHALAPLVGLNAPVRPVRGQIMVTERVRPVLDLPTLLIRQTAEGGLMIGESREEADFDDTTTPDVQRALADRALRTLPLLRDVRVVRHWAALRVMSSDGLPIYRQSPRFPGAFIASCHSGVTLAAAHAVRYADHVADGALPAVLERFSDRRFDVQEAA